MAMETPGFANQASSYSAEVARRAIFAAYARTAANTPGILAGGLLSTADMQLSAPGSGLSVNVSIGEAIVGGSEGGVQGGYYARNASTTNLTISTANPTNPRIDTIALTIADAGYTEPTGVSGNAAVLQVVTGTATSGATLTNLSGKAALPLSSLLLGYVLVPTSASSIITADISNRASLVSKASSAWTAISLVTNIIPFAGFYTPSFRYVGDKVELSGAVENNTGGGLGFPTTALGSNMPSPAFPANFSAPLESAGGLVGIASCQVSGNALIVSGCTSGTTFPTGDFISLDGCSYRLV